MSGVHNATHWLNQANEARRIAAAMGGAVAKQLMLNIAVDYDRMAEHVESIDKVTRIGRNDRKMTL
jgi:hypothetical protein